MARGRPRSISNVSAANGHLSRPGTSSPQLRRQFASQSDTIYQNNMMVLRRRDPTIISIFDQFSHVCLYHYDGKRWQKQGFEGTMFLVEHQDDPHYGFYILNRMGTGDWSRRLYPEDKMEPMGDYLMYRFFPEFTKKRIEMNLPYPLPEEHRPAFDEEFAEDHHAIDPALASKEKKGNSVTTGLWMFNMDDREPLKDVMTRLHSYIKNGEPYPEEYRYGPGHPAPPNPHLRRATETSSNAEEEDRTPKSETETDTKTSNEPPASESSEIDKLFAKLQPPAPPSNQPHTSMSAQSWFAALSGEAPLEASTPSPSPAPASSTASVRGQALLYSIFASATPPSPSHSISRDQGLPIPRDTLPPHPEEIQIVSPKPTSSALPQILNQDVISTLLGLGPDGSSRASSAAPSSAGSRRSYPNRYEGDNEYSEGEAALSEADYSTTSTVADDPAILAAGPGVPSLSFNGSSESENEESLGQRVQGDVTPRVMTRAMGPMSPPPNARARVQQYLTPPNGAPSNGAPKLTSSSSSTSVSTVNVTAPTSTTPSNATQPRGRTLVPFEADSELWPYPRAPVDERSSDFGESEIVELDFSDTRALSDPTVFSNRLQKQQQKGKKKSRRERAAEREREREAIENGWDDPTMGQAGSVDMTSRPGAPAISTPPPPPPVVQAPSVEPVPTSPIMPPAANGKQANGTSKAGTATNGTGIPKTVLDPHAAHIALLSSISSHPKAPSKEIPRKQFVQEVLSLIYSDNAFVDKLWQDYTSRTS